MLVNTTHISRLLSIQEEVFVLCSSEGSQKQTRMKWVLSLWSDKAPKSWLAVRTESSASSAGATSMTAVIASLVSDMHITLPLLLNADALKCNCCSLRCHSMTRTRICIWLLSWLGWEIVAIVNGDSRPVIPRLPENSICQHDHLHTP